jgi:hypothetical protein
VVLTVTVRSRPRRSVLAAGALGTVALAAGGLVSGCSVLGPDDPEPTSPQDADRLRAVATESLDLARRYDEAISRTPDQAGRLTAIRDSHREHAAAIGRSLDASVAPTTAPVASASAGSSGLIKALQTAERAAAERASAVCLEVAGFHAPLVGAIAAARASHAEAIA